MMAIDTIVLVRFLVQNDEKQAQVSTQLLTDEEAEKQPLFVSNVVVVEFQDSLSIRDFVSSAQNNTYDLADLLISQVAKGKGCDTTLTFDKKAAKAPNFTKL